MKILKPSYYDEFKCIADKCIDTCCAGWNITIDEKTYDYYKNIEGEFGEELKESIKIADGINLKGKYIFELKEDKKCAMLDENGFCSIYTNLGEENMCNTCKIYPRLLKNHGFIYEKNLTLSCPEVARIFINHKEKMNFILEDEEVEGIEKQVKLSEIKEDSYKTLFQIRGFAIEIAQYDKIELWQRIYFIQKFLKKVDEITEEDKFGGLEEIIRVIESEITDENVIKELNEITKINKIKIPLIRDYIRIQKKDKRLDEFSLIYDKFFGQKKGEDIVNKWNDQEIYFEKEFKENEYILENYLVCHIFNYMIGNKKLGDCFFSIVINYIVFKSMLMLDFMNKKQIKKENMIKTLYSFSRLADHNSLFNEMVCDQAKGNGYEALSYVVLLVR